MKHSLPAAVEKVLATLSEATGHTSPEIRRAILTFCRGDADPSREGAAIPEALRDYAEKVSLDATRVTDEDVAALKSAGYDEDAIFEVTVAAALGAGVTRMEHGLAALRRSR
jgi:alkylhydroperoxidase family enzyme